MSTTKLLTKATLIGIQSKKAEEVTLLNLQSSGNAIADYFIVCSGTSTTHVEAIAEGVIDAVHKEHPAVRYKKEGFQNKEWILLDYHDVIVHIFQAEKRAFYQLETLWGDYEIPLESL